MIEIMIQTELTSQWQSGVLTYRPNMWNGLDDFTNEVIGDFRIDPLNPRSIQSFKASYRAPDSSVCDRTQVIHFETREVAD